MNGVKLIIPNFSAISFLLEGRLAKLDKRHPTMYRYTNIFLSLDRTALIFDRIGFVSFFTLFFFL